MLPEPLWCGGRQRRQQKAAIFSALVSTLTVITINRNNASGLKQTLASVLKQTDREFAYVVVDGASTDESKDVIAATAGIDTWISEPDNGIYEALNKGIALSASEYVLFINSGDRLAETTTIRDAKPHLGSADIVYGNMKIESPDGGWDGFMPSVIDLRQMMHDTLWHPVSFIRRDLFDRYGMYDTSFRICGDYDWFFNVIVDKHATTRHIDQFIAIFDLTGTSSTTENRALVASEKQRAQRRWLSDQQIQKFWSAERRRATAARALRLLPRLLNRKGSRSESRH
jgi:glycosyltransferase involved in cell wall biosynthesis